MGKRAKGGWRSRVWREIEKIEFREFVSDVPMDDFGERGIRIIIETVLARREVEEKKA